MCISLPWKSPLPDYQPGVGGNFACFWSNLKNDGGYDHDSSVETLAELIFLFSLYLFFEGDGSGKKPELYICQINFL